MKAWGVNIDDWPAMAENLIKWKQLDAEFLLLGKPLLKNQAKCDRCRWGIETTSRNGTERAQACRRPFRARLDNAPKHDYRVQKIGLTLTRNRDGALCPKESTSPSSPRKSADTAVDA